MYGNEAFEIGVAHGKGLQIQYHAVYGDGPKEWTDVEPNHKFNLSSFYYRIKPEVEYIKYSSDDYKIFMDEPIMIENNPSIIHPISYKILSWNESGFFCKFITDCDIGSFTGYDVEISNLFISYDNALNNFISRKIGKPFGKEIYKLK